MTMQRLDSFTYQGKTAKAIAISRRFSFTPDNNLGIKVTPCETCNWRGFWCDYCLDTSFIVKNVYLFAKNQDNTLLFGKKGKELPEYKSLLKVLNEKRKEHLKYTNGFPSMYENINYLFEYTGNIVIGVDFDSQKHGAERYECVYELEYMEGILVQQSDITDKWKNVNEKEVKYWWQEKENDYFYLINYSYMGIEK